FLTVKRSPLLAAKCARQHSTAMSVLPSKFPVMLKQPPDRQLWRLAAFRAIPARGPAVRSTRLTGRLSIRRANPKLPSVGAVSTRSPGAEPLDLRFLAWCRSCENRFSSVHTNGAAKRSPSGRSCISSCFILHRRHGRDAMTAALKEKTGGLLGPPVPLARPV